MRAMHLYGKWNLSASQVDQWPSCQILPWFNANDSHNSKSNLLAHLPFISVLIPWGCAMASQEGKQKCSLLWGVSEWLYQHEIWTNWFLHSEQIPSATSSQVSWQPWAVQNVVTSKCTRVMQNAQEVGTWKCTTCKKLQRDMVKLL